MVNKSIWILICTYDDLESRKKALLIMIMSVVIIRVTINKTIMFNAFSDYYLVDFNLVIIVYRKLVKYQFSFHQQTH